MSPLNTMSEAISSLYRKHPITHLQEKLAKCFSFGHLKLNNSPRIQDVQSQYHYRQISEEVDSSITESDNSDILFPP